MKVKIGNFYYTVKALPPVPPREIGNRGMICYKEQEILLDSGLSPESLRVCFLHEIIHGILSESGLSFDENADEEDKIVRVISNGIYQVFSENPELIPFMWKNYGNSK